MLHPLNKFGTIYLVLEQLIWRPGLSEEPGSLLTNIHFPFYRNRAKLACIVMVNQI